MACSTANSAGSPSTRLRVEHPLRAHRRSDAAAGGRGGRSWAGLKRDLARARGAAGSPGVAARAVARSTIYRPACIAQMMRTTWRKAEQRQPAAEHSQIDTDDAEVVYLGGVGSPDARWWQDHRDRRRRTDSRRRACHLDQSEQSASMLIGNDGGLAVSDDRARRVPAEPAGGPLLPRQL